MRAGLSYARPRLRIPQTRRHCGRLASHEPAFHPHRNAHPRRRTRGPAHGAGCLPSAAAVREAHGITAWSTWRMVDGRRCYSLGVRPSGRSSVVEISSTVGKITRRSSKPNVAGSIPAVRSIPLPRPRLGYRAITVEESAHPVEWLDGVLSRNRFEEAFGALHD